MVAGRPCQLDGAFLLIAIMLNEVRPARVLVLESEITASARLTTGAGGIASVRRAASDSGARPPRLRLAWLCASLLSACGVLPTQPPLQSYVCEQGRSFGLRVDAAGQQAVVDIDGMKFSLLREAGAPEAFSCSMVRVERSGNEATLSLDGQPSHIGCWRQPARE